LRQTREKRTAASIPMASLVLIQKRQACQKRKELYEKVKNHEKYVQTVLKTWDKSKSGGLNFEELKEYLKDISQGRAPTDTEVQWVIQTATKEGGKFNPEWVSGKMEIKPPEFAAAAHAWQSYQENREMIDEVFSRFDVHKRGRLNWEELKKVLTELNDGDEPTKEEVDWVMKKSDIVGNGEIDKPELIQAIAVWYSHVDGNVASTERVPGSSSCCVLQ